MEKIQCRVKVILNKNSENSFSLRYSVKSCTALVKIIIKKEENLHTVVDTMKEVLKPNYDWFLIWNFKNTSKAITEDQEFRIKMNNMFSDIPILKSEKIEISEGVPGGNFNELISKKSPLKSIPKIIHKPIIQSGPIYVPPPHREININNDLFARYVSRINCHINEYGNCPDFYEPLTLKKKTRIINYMRNALGDPLLDENLCISISQAIKQKNARQ